MEWFIVALIVFACAGLVIYRGWQFFSELSKLPRSGESGGESDSGVPGGCHGCPGREVSAEELGLKVLPLVQLKGRAESDSQILRVVFVALFAFAGSCEMALGQDIRPPNYDEAIASKFELGSVLAGPDGRVIASKEAWPAQRKYLVDLLAENEYGVQPSDKVQIKTEVFDDGVATLGGETKSDIRRRQIAVVLERGGKQVRVDLIVWSPKDRERVPCFLGLNFRGNQSTCDDPAIRLTTSWCDSRSPGVVDNRATEASRANQSERWPIAEVVGRGYAVASAHYSDIDPDFDDGFENGVHALFPDWRCDAEHPNRWGSIAAWAWGLSRLADVLEKLDGIQADGLMVLGHSRLGKTALWAGATDERFRVVISNNSGCGGAALSKRIYGESVARINGVFPHWFNRNFRKYNDREETMSFDQHQLIAAIAPRPVYIASASKDKWADPLGELLSGHYASAAYELFGKRGIAERELPSVNTPIGSDSIGYHLRDGEHDMLLYDWQQFMTFAEKTARKAK